MFTPALFCSWLSLVWHYGHFSLPVAEGEGEKSRRRILSLRPEVNLLGPAWLMNPFLQLAHLMGYE